MTASALALTPALRRRSLAAILLHMTAIGLAIGLLLPLNALVLERWGVATWLNGLVSAMPSLAILAVMPFATRICGRLGTLRSMVVGCLVGIVAILLMPLLPDVGVWMGLRFVVGAAMALPWLVGETWINALALEHQRGRVLAIYAAALFLGFALGPVLLGLVGTEGWAGFLLTAGALASALLPILWARSLAPPMPARPALGVLDVARRAPSVLAAALVAGFAETGLAALLPLFAVRGGLSETQALGLLSVFLIGGIALQYPLGWLADRLGRRPVLALVAAGAAALLAALAAADLGGWAPQVIVFALGGLALGFYSIGLALLGERFAAGDLAVANAAFILLYEAGSTAGPTLAGAAMDLSSRYGLSAAVGAFCLALAVIAGGRWWRERRTPE